MATRARCSATPRQVAALLAELDPTGDEKRLASSLHGSYDEFIERNVEFLVKLVAITSRPSPAVVTDAVKITCGDMAMAIATSFGVMVPKVISHCKKVGRSVSTGHKLQPCTFRLVKALELKKPTIATRGRKLLRRRSSGPSDCEVVEPSRVPQSPPIELSSEDDLETPAKPETFVKPSLQHIRADVLSLYGCGSSTDPTPSPAAPVAKPLEYLTPDGLVRALDCG